MRSFCETGQLISAQTQTTVWSLKILHEAEQGLRSALRWKDEGNFFKKDQCQDQCGSRTRWVELVNDIDHVTGCTDEDQVRFSVAIVHEGRVTTGYFNLPSAVGVGIPQPVLALLEAASRLSFSAGPAALFLTLVSRQQPFAILSSNNDSFPLPAIHLHPPLSLSVYLSPSVRAASFSSLVLATGNNSLSSLSPSLPSSCLPGYIGTSVRCLGLRQPVSYSKCFLALASMCLSTPWLSVPQRSFPIRQLHLWKEQSDEFQLAGVN